MGNPIPAQERSVDPYASYNSDIVNKLTRVVSDGNDILLYPSPINVSATTLTTVTAEAGSCIKDDVLIAIQNIIVDMADSDFYVDSGGGVWNEIGYYYLVLEYSYVKIRPAPAASVKIILPSQRLTVYNPSLHLFLACLEVAAPGGVRQVTDILDYDPENPTNGRRTGGANPNFAQVRQVSGAYTADPADGYLAALSGSVITLPLSADGNQPIVIYKADAGAAITVQRQGGDTIEGQTSISLTAIYDSVMLLPDQITTWIEI